MARVYYVTYLFILLLYNFFYETPFVQVKWCTVNHNYPFKMNPTSLFSTLMEEKRLELNRAHMCPLAKLMLQQVYLYLSVFSLLSVFCCFLFPTTTIREYSRELIRLGSAVDVQNVGRGTLDLYDKNKCQE